MLYCDWLVFPQLWLTRFDPRCQWVVPLAVRRRTALRLLCFLVVGIRRSGNFHSTVPVDFGRLKSYENCLFERGSRSINLASFQCFKKKNEHFSSPTTTSSARINDNFLTTARNYFWSTTKSKQDAMWLAPVSSSRGETENIRVFDTGIHKTREYPKHT